MIMLLLDSGARRPSWSGFGGPGLLARCGPRDRQGPAERVLPFGRKTAVALDRYLRVRSRHGHAASPWLWLGQKGPLTATGLAQML
jgi:hypothetical protein